MKPLQRKPVNKKQSAKQFKRNVATTKVANLQATSMRGGWRM